MNCKQHLFRKNYQAIDLHNFKVKLEKEICKETDAQHITIVIEGNQS